MTARMSKPKRVLFSVFCVILALCTSLAGSAYVLGEAWQPTYFVEDIRLWTGEEPSEAQAYFDSIGYTLCNSDLNPHTDTGQFVFIGYKTTTNRDLALTDIRMLGMDTGYQLYDYAQIVEYLSAQNQGTAQKLYAASQEFIDNYDEGSPKAEEAYKGLNLFNIGDEANTKLGDYILDGKANLKFFTQLVVKGSAGTVNSVIGLLNIGIAPYNNDYNPDTQEEFTSNWAERLSQSSLWEDYAAGITAAEQNDLHKQYNDNAKVLFSAIQDFATLYENAKARYSEDKVTDNSAFDSYDSLVDNVDTLQQEDTDYLYIAMYEVLNRYNVNDSTKLGDWLLDIGKMTSDQVDIMQLYPLVEVMGDSQCDAVGLNGLIAAVNNLSDNDQMADYDEELDNAGKALEESGLGDSLSLWDVSNDDIESKNIAYTSDAVRKQSAQNSIGQTTGMERFDAKFQEVLKIINFAIGASFLALGVAELSFKICLCFAASASAFNSFCVTALSVITVLSKVLFWAGIAVLAVQIIYMIVVWIIELFSEKLKYLSHSDKPDFVFDAAETSSGIATIKYKSVLDSEGNVGDLNANKQYKWCLLATTNDPRVGSPIVVDGDNTVFNVVYNNSSTIGSFDNVEYFGEREAGNTNAFCDEAGASCYIHYRTEASLSGGGGGGSVQPTPEEPDVPEPTDDGTTTYVSDILVSVGKNPDEAKANIVKHKGKFFTVDSNLSPNQSFATFIGYEVTTDPESAITDIRIAPYAGKTENVIKGDVTYTRVENVGVYVGTNDEQTRPQADALYFTRDTNAGDPILADGFHIVTDFADVQEGWEPVALFGADYPYDFNTAYINSNTSPLGAYSGYYSTKSYELSKHQGVYVYFEPSVKYTSGTKYLSGFFFAAGYNFIEIPNYKNSLLEKRDDFHKFIKSIPHTGYNNTVLNRSCCYGIWARQGTDVHSFDQHIVYTYTYNPKRALYDVQLYHGTTYYDQAPYTQARKTASGATVSYVACNFISQQSYARSRGIRFIHSGNTFIDSAGMQVDDSNAKLIHDREFTGIKPENVKFGYSETNLIPYSLYVSGHISDKQPIKLSDVVMTENVYNATSKEGGISCTLKNEKALDGSAAKGEFHAVGEMKNPADLKPIDIGTPTFGNVYVPNLPDGHLYIYLKGAKAAKKQYIAALSIGSMSRESYQRINTSATKEELLAVDSIVDTQAISTATSGCSDEVLMTNIALSSQSDAWYNWQSDGKANRTPPENKPAAYIGVTRTDDPDKAIKGIVLYKLNDTIAPDTVNIGGVEYKCAGNAAPIKMNDTTYFLYYTTNPGALPGEPIEEITFDATPLISGYATNLVYDKDSDTLSGNPDQTVFIHMKYQHARSDIYNELYIGKGSNRRAALCDLLSQNCVEFVDIDLNTGVKGDTIYLGYSTLSVDWDAVNSKTTDEEKREALLGETEEAIYDIVLTKGEAYNPNGIVCNNIYYHPVSPVDLTAGSGNELHIYYASPYWSDVYNRKNNAYTDLPQNVYTSHITKLGFARYDRVPYNTSLEGAANSQQSVSRWEYVMFSDNKRVANFNSGAVMYNTTSNFADDIRLTMFAQRYDGSVKPSAEITGGFVSEKMAVGKVVSNEN